MPPSSTKKKRIPKQSSQRVVVNRQDDNDTGNDVTDERFLAAVTRPQFSSGRSHHHRRHHHHGDNNNSTNDDNTNNDNENDEAELSDDNLEQFGRRKKQLRNVDNENNNNNDDDNNDNTCYNSDDNNDDGVGFGKSLTAAIQSDDRFKEALSNRDKFGCVPSLDKYGRKTNKEKKNKTAKKSKDKKKKKKKNQERTEDDSDDSDDSDAKEEPAEEEPLKGDGKDDMESRIAYLNALSRGDISTSSDDDDDSSEDDDNDDSDDGNEDDSDSDKDDDDDDDDSISITGQAGVLDPSYNRTPDKNDKNNKKNNNSNDDNDNDEDEDSIDLITTPTNHLAILNLDWAHIRAVDVYAMLHSFCPPGTLEKVEVYPSDFGRERMEKEKVEGPVGLWEDDDASSASEASSDDDDESRASEASSNNADGNSASEASSDDADGISNDVSNNDDSDSDEDIDMLNMDEATAKLYAHFPQQSQLKTNKNSKNQNNSRKSKKYQKSNANMPDDYENDEGFNHEKLRAYEASKLKYYFAIATFTSPDAADAVYHHVDGMEMEHSAAEIDVRALPIDQYPTTIQNRTMRDSAHELPSKYMPPESVVTALRQSRVTCSWETGDEEREKKLTRYGMGKEAWEGLLEGDDIKFYLATSSASEDDDDDGASEDDASVASNNGGGGKDGKDGKNSHGNNNGKGKKNGKSKNMRALLGLGGDSDDDDDDDNDDNDGTMKELTNHGQDDSISEDSSSGSDDGDEAEENDSDNHEEDEGEDDDEGEQTTKQITYTPGKRNLEEKIRSKLHSKQISNENNGKGNQVLLEEAVTPFQKYLDKRKEKRKERKQAIRNKRKNQEGDDEGGAGGGANNNNDDGMYEIDPEFGVAQFSDEEGDDHKGGSKMVDDDDAGEDGFFLGEKTASSSNSGKGGNNKKKSGGKSNKEKQMAESKSAGGKDDAGPSTKEELELLIAGDDVEEHEKDYDMRGLAKLEKHANKKLKGKRKRQLETLASNVSGQEFKIDTTDNRFAALLDGTDDRFGIDRTNPLYKETGAMKTLLEEQTKRRKKNRGKRDDGARAGNGTGMNDGPVSSGGGGNQGSDGWVDSSSGALALSSLVKSLQQKVPKTPAEGKLKKKKKKSGQ